MNSLNDLANYLNKNQADNLAFFGRSPQKKFLLSNILKNQANRVPVLELRENDCIFEFTERLVNQAPCILLLNLDVFPSLLTEPIISSQVSQLCSQGNKYGIKIVMNAPSPALGMKDNDASQNRILDNLMIRVFSYLEKTELSLSEHICHYPKGLLEIALNRSAQLDFWIIDNLSNGIRINFGNHINESANRLWFQQAISVERFTFYQSTKN